MFAHAEKVVLLDVKSRECDWEAGVIFSSANSSLPLLSPLSMYRRAQNTTKDQQKDSAGR